MFRPDSNHLGLCFALLATCLGCSTEREAELLDVYEVTPERLEPGHMVVVRGAGFPPGRHATVRLVGTLYRPGHHPRPARVELDGRAVSAERVDARFNRDALEAFEGRGTLRGRVTVLFAAAHHRGSVVGSSPEMILDVTEGSDASVDALERRRVGDGFLARLGLEVGEPGPDTTGLAVTSVEEGSTAEQVGILTDDRLVELDEVRLLTVHDLVPAPGAETTELRVERRGQAAPFVVRLPVAEDHEGMRVEQIVAAQIALAWLLLAVVLLAPSAGLIDWLGRRTHRARGGRRGKRSWRRRLGRSLRTVPVLGLIMACAAGVPALDRLGQLIVPLEAIAVGVLAIRVSSAWLASTGSDGVTRLIAVLHAVGSATMITIGLLGISALGGTTDLSGLASQQEANPLRWALFTTPLAPLLGVVLLVGAGSAPKEIARGDSAHARVARVIDDALLAVVTGCACGVLLGGWGGGANPLRAGGYVAATLLLWMWLRQVRRASRITLRSALAGGALALTAVGLSVSRIALRPAPELEAALAQVTGGAVVLVALLVVARVALQRTSRSAAPAHPFL